MGKKIKLYTDYTQGLEDSHRIEYMSKTGRNKGS